MLLNIFENEPRGKKANRSKQSVTFVQRVATEKHSSSIKCIVMNRKVFHFSMEKRAKLKENGKSLCFGARNGTKTG